MLTVDYDDMWLLFLVVVDLLSGSYDPAANLITGGQL